MEWFLFIFRSLENMYEAKGLIIISICRTLYHAQLCLFVKPHYRINVMFFYA